MKIKIESQRTGTIPNYPKNTLPKTFPKWRTESIKGGGNAIVPQVAFQIFKAINEFHSSGA